MLGIPLIMGNSENPYKLGCKLSICQPSQYFVTQENSENLHAKKKTNAIPLNNVLTNTKITVYKIF